MAKNQFEIPKMGFGTYGLKGEETFQAVSTALEAGLRHIDTAPIYGNEAEVGRAIKRSPIVRDELFLTTKVWRTSLTYEKVKQSLYKSLNHLKTEYVDLLLIHWPNREVSLEESLQAFKDLKKANKILHIGVSNFPLSLLKKAKAFCPDLLTNQVEYHPLLSQKTLLDYMGPENLFLTAYCPLIRGHVFRLQQIVLMAKKYRKTPAQITLKWLIEQKNVSAIFRSKNKKHIEENCNIFDFDLEEKDREQLFRLSRNQRRILNPPFAPEWDD